MLKQVLATACLILFVAGAAGAQAQKKSGTKSVMHDITVSADTVYTGTMELAVSGGKVTGDMRIVAPMEITGKVAGTSKGGVLTLEFPFLIVQENCEGTVRMDLELAGKSGHAAGTMEAVGCSGDEKVTGTVELKPSAPKSAK